MKLRKKDINRVLVIGMAGGLARLTVDHLLKTYPSASVIGVDSRPPGVIFKDDRIQYLQMKYSRTNFEKLFRNHQFDVVLHLGRMTHVSVRPDPDRLDLNLMGSNLILDRCLHFGVKKVVVLSTFHVYGALPDNTVFIQEDAPLRASIRYPELHDVVEMDRIATNWMWKHQKDIQMLVLRPCNIIGPQINNVISRYLKAKFMPIPFDYNPMMQFIHEDDMARIIVDSLRQVPTGVYNIAPDESIPLNVAKKYLGLPTVPTSMFFWSQIAQLVKKSVWPLPNYLIDYLKFSCIIENESLKQYLTAPLTRRSTMQTLAQLLPEGARMLDTSPELSAISTRMKRDHRARAAVS